MKKSFTTRTALLSMGLMMGMSVFAQFPSDYTGTPYSGTPIQIPAERLECENFDLGGSGVAFSWVKYSADGTGAAGNTDYRDDANFIGNGGSAHNVGWNDGADWAAYTIEVAEDGDYEVTLNVASGSANARIQFEVDGVKTLMPYSYGATASWDDYQEKVFSPLHLTAGKHLLKLNYTGTNADYVDFKRVGDLTSSFANLVIPGTVEAEYFDEGGEGVAYHWNNTSVGQTVRSDAGFVGTAGYGDAPHNHVGWADGDNWLNYTVNVEKDGYYQLTIYASANPGGEFYFLLDGTQLANNFTFDGNDWNAYKEIVFDADNALKLTAGSHKLTLYYVKNFNLDKMVFTEVEAPVKTLAIPGKIEAEDFDDDTWSWGNPGAADKNDNPYRPGIKFVQPMGTGYGLGETDGGTTTYYTVTVAEDGEYSIVGSAATGADDKTFTISFDGEQEKTLSVVKGGWSTFNETTGGEGFQLTAGEHVMKFYTGGGVNVDYFTATKTGELAVTIDIKASETTTNAGKVQGDGTIGGTSPNDEYTYTFTVPEDGKYNIQAYTACGNADQDIFNLTIDGGNPTDDIKGATDGWTNFQPTDCGDFSLKAGEHTLVLTVVRELNLQGFTLKKVGDYEEPVVTIDIDADETTTNTDKVNADGTIGNTAPGDVFTYTVNVDEDGNYDIAAITACGNAEQDEFVITIDGEKQLGTTESPIKGSTDGWDKFSPTSCGVAALTKGEHTITLTVVRELNLKGFTLTKKGDLDADNDDTIPTGISAVNASVKAADAIYTISGTRVAQPTQKGVYIQNGKKFVVK